MFFSKFLRFLVDSGRPEPSFSVAGVKDSDILANLTFSGQGSDFGRFLVAPGRLLALPGASLLAPRATPGAPLGAPGALLGSPWERFWRLLARSVVRLGALAAWTGPDGARGRPRRAKTSRKYCVIRDRAIRPEKSDDVDRDGGSEALRTCILATSPKTNYDSCRFGAFQVLRTSVLAASIRKILPELRF